MWKLAKTELAYNRLYIIGAVIFCFLIITPYLIAGGLSSTGHKYYPISIIFWGFFFARWGSYMFFKDNLERVHASLPLKFKDIAIARLLPGLILWYGLLLLLIAGYLVFYGSLDIINVWSLFLANGLAISINAFVYVWHDFIFQKPGKYRKIISYLFYYPVAFATIIIVYFSMSASFSFFNEIQDSIREVFFSLWASILINTFGIVLMILSYKMYQNRYSYLLSEFGLKSNIRVKTGDIT